MKVFTFTFPTKARAVTFCHAVATVKADHCTDPEYKDGVWLVTVVSYENIPNEEVPTEDDLRDAEVAWAGPDPDAKWCDGWMS